MKVVYNLHIQVSLTTHFLPPPPTPPPHPLLPSKCRHMVFLLVLQTFRIGVGSIPVVGNSPLIAGWIV